MEASSGSNTSQRPPATPIHGLRSAEVTAELERSGYARLGPFLSPEELVGCRAIFDEAEARLDRPLGAEWLPTILLPEADIRAFITTELRAIIEGKLTDLLVPGDLELVRLDYSVKPATPESELGPHQDFSLVDERQSTSLYLWIPLCDTDQANGTLHVVPGSHRFANQIRSRHVPAVFDDALDLVRDAAVGLDCTAGELILMVSGVIHFSPANRSDHLRLAAHGIVKPIAAPLVFFFADERTPPDKVECYELDMERYVQQIHQGRPDGDVPLSRMVKRPVTSMSRQRFLAGMDEFGPDSQ